MNQSTTNEEKNSVEFLQFSFGPEIDKKLDKWMRQLGVSDCGEIFIPAIAAGESELGAVMCAAQDSASIALSGGHCFMPLSWFESRFPDQSTLWGNFRKKAEKGARRFGLGKEGSA